MNVREVGELVSLAIQGRRVLVVSSTMTDAAAAAEGVRQFAGPAQQIRRTRGAELISYLSGGRITFASTGSMRERGLGVDVVFIDEDVSPTAEVVDRYALTIANNPRGTIMCAERDAREKISA